MDPSVERKRFAGGGPARQGRARHTGFALVERVACRVHGGGWGDGAAGPAGRRRVAIVVGLDGHQQSPRTRPLSVPGGKREVPTPKTQNFVQIQKKSTAVRSVK